MRKKIVLSCSICKSRNYTTEKSNHASTNRTELKKFCKVCKEHTPHLETK